MLFSLWRTRSEAYTPVGSIDESNFLESTSGPILTAPKFPRLGDKRQHWLIAFLTLVLRVVALAPAHLLSGRR